MSDANCPMTLATRNSVTAGSRAARKRRTGPAFDGSQARSRARYAEIPHKTPKIAKRVPPNSGTNGAVEGEYRENVAINATKVTQPEKRNRPTPEAWRLFVLVAQPHSAQLLQPFRTLVQEAFSTVHNGVLRMVSPVSLGAMVQP